MTWISADKGWVLVGKQCGTTPCPQLLFTDDGGSTWTPQAFERVEPTEVAGCEQLRCVSNVRFASSSVGYLWSEEGGLFATVDGGRTWKVTPPARILSLEPAGRVMIRVVAPQGLPAPVQVDRAAVGSVDWAPIDVGTIRDFGGTVITATGAVYVAFNGNPAGGSPDAHTAFVRSTDGGQRWASFTDPCGGHGGQEQDAVSSAAGPRGLFAVLCRPRMGDGRSSVRVSSDTGRHFGPPRPLPEPSPISGQLAVASATDVVVAITGAGNQPSVVWHSGDTGNSWTRALTAPAAVEQGGVPPAWLGFENDEVGRVTFGTDALWTSRDAGRTWHMSPLP